MEQIVSIFVIISTTRDQLLDPNGIDEYSGARGEIASRSKPLPLAASRATGRHRAHDEKRRLGGTGSPKASVASPMHPARIICKFIVGSPSGGLALTGSAPGCAQAAVHRQRDQSPAGDPRLSRIFSKANAPQSQPLPTSAATGLSPATLRAIARPE